MLKNYFPIRILVAEFYDDYSSEFDRKSKMQKHLVLGVVLFAAVAANNQAAFANSPNFDGIWEVSFYSEPDRTYTGYQCFSFLQTNNVHGVSKFSGQWKILGNSKISGQWIQLGDHVYGWATTERASQRFVSFSGNIVTKKLMGGVSYIQFDAQDASFDFAGDFIMRKKPCSVVIK